MSDDLTKAAPAVASSFLFGLGVTLSRMSGLRTVDWLLNFRNKGLLAVAPSAIAYRIGECVKQPKTQFDRLNVKTGSTIRLQDGHLVVELALKEFLIIERDSRLVIGMFNGPLAWLHGEGMESAADKRTGCVGTASTSNQERARQVTRLVRLSSQSCNCLGVLTQADNQLFYLTRCKTCPDEMSQKEYLWGCGLNTEMAAEGAPITARQPNGPACDFPISDEAKIIKNISVSLLHLMGMLRGPERAKKLLRCSHVGCPN
jgi:hypothetical protein